MSAAANAIALEGRVVHKASNALRMELRDQLADPSAVIVAVQDGAGGGGARMAMLFGFKNGGTGRHLVTFADASTMVVESRDGKSTLVTRDDQPVASIERGETSRALLPDGTEVYQFIPDHDGEVTADLFRMLITTPAGEAIGRLDIIRRASGWNLANALDNLLMGTILWDQTGLPLKVPIQGARLSVTTGPINTGPINSVQRDILVAACVDIAIGLRPYFKGMG